MDHRSPRLRATLATKDDSGRILLLKHIRPHGEYWVLPGGGVEYGEPVEKSLEREIREELGAVVQVGKLLAIGELITPDRHVVDFFMTGTLDRHDNFTILYDEGIGAAEWVEPDRLKTMNFLPREVIPALIEWTKGAKLVPIYLGKYNLA